MLRDTLAKKVNLVPWIYYIRKSQFAAMSKIPLKVSLALGLLFGSFPLSAGHSILNRLNSIATLSSTVPANGDLNPYGLVRVPKSRGKLIEGSYLVSNFNNSANLQGTGTTIVQISPQGTFNLFTQIDPTSLPGSCPGGVGLTTALAVLESGWVIVGSLPTSDGTSATAQAGCLIVLDSQGTPVETISGPLINGPWDMTASECQCDNEAVLFVTNVLNGTVAGGGSIVNQGTVLRIDLKVSKTRIPTVESMTVIGNGFSQRTDPNALVIGPTGVGLSSCKDSEHATNAKHNGKHKGEEDDFVLYVADTVNSQIQVIERPFTRRASAGIGKTLTSGGDLNGPLGLTVAPNRHILVVNGGNGFVTEITPSGRQIATKLLDSSGSPPGAGALFGVFFDPKFGLVFVDDATNTLNLLH
jgi:hypothetical protein